jgi:hypothetical protein
LPSFTCSSTLRYHYLTTGWDEVMILEEPQCDTRFLAGKTEGSDLSNQAIRLKTSHWVHVTRANNFTHSSSCHSHGWPTLQIPELSSRLVDIYLLLGTALRGHGAALDSSSLLIYLHGGKTDGRKERLYERVCSHTSTALKESLWSSTQNFSKEFLLHPQLKSLHTAGMSPPHLSFLPLVKSNLSFNRVKMLLWPPAPKPSVSASSSSCPLLLSR